MKGIMRGKYRRQRLQREKTAIVHESNQNYSLLTPDEIEVALQDVFSHSGAKKELQNLLSFLDDPEKYHNFSVQPHTKYIVTGQSGCGKETLVCAVAKEANLPIFVIEPTFFYNIKAALDQELANLFSDVQEVVSLGVNCILLFKELQCLIGHELEVSMPFIEQLLGYFKMFPQLVVFATLSGTATIPNELLSSSAFTKIIDLLPPDINERKKIFTFFLKDVPVKEDLDIHKLALNTYQMTVSYIKKLVKDAKLMALKHQKEALEYEHFAEALAESEFGYQSKKLIEKVRLATARHEAGHVIAGYFSDPDGYKISKVDVTPRSIYAGVTLTNVDEEDSDIFKSDLKNIIIHTFGGMVAETFYYNENSTGVANDLEHATKTAIAYFKYFGMSDDIGPVCLDSDVFNSAVLNSEADREIQNLLKELYKKTEDIILEHADKLEELSQALMEKEVLYTEEILQILKK